jgi:precorrin-2 dehydrogenase/sirohydrochlorin ferrochelatase
LDLEGRRAVVIGGGVIAERKVDGLLAAGAAITVISPEVTQGIERLAEQGRATVILRRYEPGDLAGAFIAVVGTDDTGVNRSAALEARATGVLVNTVDDVDYCDFIAPAVVRQGDITLAISTNGKSPSMARLLRETLEAYLTPDYAHLLTVLQQVRMRLRAAGLKPGPDQWQTQIDGDLRTLVQTGALEQAEERLFQGLVAACQREPVATP